MIKRRRRRKRKERRVDVDRIIRKDEDDSEIRRNAHSIGYQVIHQGAFIMFVPKDINRADHILDAVQALHEKGVRTPWLKQYG